jgi:hypothetical protein
MRTNIGNGTDAAFGESVASILADRDEFVAQLAAAQAPLDFRDAVQLQAAIERWLQSRNGGDRAALTPTHVHLEAADRVLAAGLALRVHQGVLTPQEAVGQFWREHNSGSRKSPGREGGSH